MVRKVSPSAGSRRRTAILGAVIAGHHPACAEDRQALFRTGGPLFQEPHHQEPVLVAAIMIESPALQSVGLEALAFVEPARRLVVADDMEHDLLEMASGMGEGGAQKAAAEPCPAVVRPDIEAPQHPLMRLTGARLVAEP